jgi:hypothetical protein
MGERPNVRRVMVLVIFCKRMKSPKCINIDTKVSYRRRGWLLLLLLLLRVQICCYFSFMNRFCKMLRKQDMREGRSED